MPPVIKRLIGFNLRAGAVTLILGLGILFAPRLYTSVYALPFIRTQEAVTPKQVAIVFGAGLRWDGSPSAVLRDRVTSAIELYQSGAVQKLLMSGNAPQPASMRDFAIQMGVPAEDILIDDGGLRTYDTCHRAREVFGLSEAVLVTQLFHLPRAIYTCNALEVSAQGVPAYQSRYWRGAMVFWNLRETLATFVALWDVHVGKPQPSFSQAETSLAE